jgi:hypothetical protein
LLIRADVDQSAIAIGQASHAWVSGQLARAWGNERFGAVEPWEEVCLGAEQHDVGWAAWDARPTLNPETGLPHSFIELPFEPRLEIWAGAAERLVSQSRYAALLVSMHGTALHERFGPKDSHQSELQAYLEAERAFQRQLIATLDADAAQIARNQRLLWAWDSLSLALCLEWDATKLDDVPAAEGDTSIQLTPLGGGRTEIDPWPFASDAVSLRAEGRRLAGRFADQAGLQAALDAAPWVALEFELVGRARG